MQCPKCGAQMPEGSLYCEKCGEEIHIVPDYDPKIDLNIDSALEGIGNQVGEDYEKPKKGSAWRVGNNQEISEKKPASKWGFRVLTAVIIGLFVLILVLLYFSVQSVKRMNSPEYQVEQAEKYRALGAYGEAIACYGRAIELQGEDIELLNKLSDLYYLQNDQVHYEDCLRRILRMKDVDEELLRRTREKMIALLKKKGDFDGIHRLLFECEDKKLMEEYGEFLAWQPEFSLPSGTYEGMQSLKILWEGNGTVYYTLDDTVPGENSTEYTLPIVLDYGTVIVKACFINEYGVKSRITEAEYVIERPLEIPQ